jgi:hypothetical protein
MTFDIEITQVMFGHCKERKSNFKREDAVSSNLDSRLR